MSRVKYVCSEQSRNLLYFGIELLKVEIPKMSTSSRIELPHYQIACSVNGYVVGQGRWPQQVYKSQLLQNCQSLKVS